MAKGSNPTRVVLLIVLALVATSGVSYMMRPKELIDWRTDYNAARAEAEKSHKFLVVYLTATWCGPCQRMKHTTWADQSVATAMNDFVPVKIDVDEQKQLAYDLSPDKAIPMPQLLMITPDGRIVMAATGYMDPTDFVKWLQGKPVAAGIK